MARLINYLDASAAVRLVLDEPGSGNLREYFDGNVGFHITSLCLGEALGVLKRKTSKKDYFDKCYVLLAYVRGKPWKINVDEIDLSSSDVFAKAEEIAGRYKHKIDLSDSLQLVIMKQKFSKPLLITADRELASAAKKEGVLVWNCELEAVPPDNALPLS